MLFRPSYGGNYYFYMRGWTFSLFKFLTVNAKNRAVQIHISLGSGPELELEMSRWHHSLLGNKARKQSISLRKRKTSPTTTQLNLLEYWMAESVSSKSYVLCCKCDFKNYICKSLKGADMPWMGAMYILGLPWIFVSACNFLPQTTLIVCNHPLSCASLVLMNSPVHRAAGLWSKSVTISKC